MASPVSDKLALFADRFRARADVYAVRWENTRTGTLGWMPAVAGGWRKGMDRRDAVHLQLVDGDRPGRVAERSDLRQRRARPALRPPVGEEPLDVVPVA